MADALAKAERELDDARRELAESRDRRNELWKQTLEMAEQAKKPGTPGEVAALRRLARIAADASTTFHDWTGHASTRNAAWDSMDRLSRALDAAGFPYQGNHALDWRGSVLKELNSAGFFHSDEQDAFVFDPDAEKARPYRNHGNAVGPTLKELVVILRSAKVLLDSIETYKRVFGARIEDCFNAAFWQLLDITHGQLRRVPPSTPDHAKEAP